MTSSHNTIKHKLTFHHFARHSKNSTYVFIDFHARCARVCFVLVSRRFLNNFFLRLHKFTDKNFFHSKNKQNVQKLLRRGLIRKEIEILLFLYHTFVCEIYPDFVAQWNFFFSVPNRVALCDD